MKKEDFIKNWNDYLQDVSRLNWNFDFNSKESKAVEHHIRELKKLAKQAAENLK